MKVELLEVDDTDTYPFVEIDDDNEIGTALDRTYALLFVWHSKTRKLVIVAGDRSKPQFTPVARQFSREHAMNFALAMARLTPTSEP